MAKPITGIKARFGDKNYGGYKMYEFPGLFALAYLRTSRML